MRNAIAKPVSTTAKPIGSASKEHLKLAFLDAQTCATDMPHAVQVAHDGQSSRTSDRSRK